MKRIPRITGALMLAGAVGFVAFALQHPEMSFPWNGTVTALLYAAWLISALLLLIVRRS